MSDLYPYNYKGYPAGLDYPWSFPMFSEKERDLRWNAIRRAMQKNHLDCLIIGAAFGYMPSARHLYYVSNYYPYFNRGTFAMFPLREEPQLEVSNNLGPQFFHVASEVSWIRDIVGSIDPVQTVVEKIKQLRLEQGRIGIVGYKSGMFPASVYELLRENFPAATFQDGTAALAEAMNKVSRESEEELTMLKKACAILDMSYDAVAAAMKPGIKECELWAIVTETIVKNGGWYPFFLLATSGPRPTFLRAPASQNVLAPGDIVMFEVDAIFGGATPQTFYALSLGHPAKEIEEMFRFCNELYLFALSELEKKRNFREVLAGMSGRIHAAGYEPMTPQIHIYDYSGEMPMDSPAQPGDYFTVHPNVCIKDYTLGAKVGDCVRMAKDGRMERLQKTSPILNIIEI